MTADDMRALATELRRRLGPAWARIVAWLRDNNSLSDVEARIRAGDYAGALEGLTEAATHFANEVAAGWKVAAHATSKWLDGQLDDLVNFDETNQGAVAAVARGRLDTLTNVVEGQKEMVQAVIEDGLSHGENPRVIARDLKGSIGLTDTQAIYVANFRRELQDGDYTAALTRELVDGNHARTLQRLAAAGGRDGLTDAQIAAFVAKYADNWVDFRAETIARTEGLRAAHAGGHLGYQQAVDRGVLDPADLVRTWKHTRRGRYSREFHAHMNVGEVVGLDQPFESGLGNQLLYPCDPDAPPEETVNCTCVVITRYRPQIRQLAVAGVSRGLALAGR